MKRIISTCLSFLMLNSVITSTSLAVGPPFSQAEDQKLTELVSEYGESNWELIASLMGNRTTRQCRERWKKCLSCPEISTPFTPEEDNLLKQKYQKIGPHWSEINKFFKDKSDAQLKNRYKFIKKKKEDEVVAQQEATQNDDVLTEAIGSTYLDNLPNYEVFDNDSFSLETNTSIGENFLNYNTTEVFDNDSFSLETNTSIGENSPSYNTTEVFSNESSSLEVNDPIIMEEDFDEILGRYCSSDVLKEEILQLCDDVTKILKDEPTLLKIDGPTIVVGDLHGDIKALEYCCREYFLNGIRREGQNILFLGDYVDRGKYGMEVIASLFKLKTMFPGNVFLLRGNHEEIDMNRVYGFSKECSLKYGQHDGNNVLKRINNTFNHLSLAAVVNKSTFCVHGGISPELDINQINDIQKPYSASSHKATPLVNDLLWSDPDKSIEEDFCQNQRGVGQKYGVDATKNFLERNELSRIIRAHQVAEKGFEDVFEDGSVITIFSSPGYDITPGGLVLTQHCAEHGNCCFHGYKIDPVSGKHTVYYGGHAHCFTHKYNNIQPGYRYGINSGAIALVTGNEYDDIYPEIYTRELPDDEVTILH